MTRVILVATFMEHDQELIVQWFKPSDLPAPLLVEAIEINHLITEALEHDRQRLRSDKR